jgi:hypothetical protein
MMTTASLLLLLLPILNNIVVILDFKNLGTGTTPVRRSLIIQLQQQLEINDRTISAVSIPGVVNMTVCTT